MIISIMQRFTHSLSPSVLAITSSSIEIALYAPAAILEGYFYTLATAVNGLFLPRVSRYIAEKREDSILKLMIQLGRYQIGVLGLVFIGFICVGKEFMVAWMGPDYTKTYYCTLIILIPTLISSTQQIASTATIAKKRIKPEALFRIFSGVLGLGISYVASLSLGAIGICIGAGAAALLDRVFLNYVYKKQVGINVFEFYKKCYLPALPCYLIAAVLGIWLTSYIPLVGWIGVFSKACVVAVIFAAVMFFGYLSKEEKSRILSILKIGAGR
jgi:O-antigen/teichoic acid export membrane protein